MRILFLAGRELTYQRNDVLLRAFRRLGEVEVVENTHPARSLIRNSLWVGLLALPKLLTGKYDLIFVGFYGHLLMLGVGIIARLRGMPVLFDVFVSNYDTLVQDRQTVSPTSLAAKMARWLDKTSCCLANHLLIDTQLHVDFFVQTYHLPPEKFSVLPVGCNEDIFSPTKERPTHGSSEVLYYCTYMPLHGADVVVEAAKLLAGEAIRFQLIGTGQEFARVQQAARGMENVRLTPFTPLESLRDEIARADICLGGHFGASDKAGRVVPGKVYQILAMARPLIASDSPANRGVLTHNVSALLCPPGDPHALAAAILTLHQNPTHRAQLAHAGRAVYSAQCSEAVITTHLREIIQGL